MEDINQLFLKYNLDYTVRKGLTGRVLSTSVKTDRYWIIIRQSTTLTSGAELYFADWDKEYKVVKIKPKPNHSHTQMNRSDVFTQQYTRK